MVIRTLRCTTLGVAPVGFAALVVPGKGDGWPMLGIVCGHVTGQLELGRGRRFGLVPRRHGRALGGLGDVADTAGVVDWGPDLDGGAAGDFRI